MGSSGGRKRRITKDRVLTEIKEADYAFLTTTEIVDRLPASRQAVNNRLRELVERGELETRLSSNIRFYWLPGRVADDPSERVVGDELVLDLDDRLHEELEKRANEEEKSPERLATDLIDEGLEESRLLWEATKNVAVGFALVFTIGIIVQAGDFPDIVYTVTMGTAIIGMFFFIIMFMATMLNPIADQVGERLGDWWDSRRE